MMPTRKLLLTASALLVTISTCLPANAGFKPSDIYKQYLAKLYWARQMKDIAPYMMERARNEELSLGPDDQARRLKWWKRGYVHKFQVIKEEVVPSQGSSYTSYAFIKGKGFGYEKGKLLPCEAMAVMIMENGGWKVQRTGWTALTSVK
jgi:hypothetical protein